MKSETKIRDLKTYNQQSPNFLSKSTNISKQIYVRRLGITLTFNIFKNYIADFIVKKKLSLHNIYSTKNSLASPLLYSAGCTTTCCCCV